MKKIIFILPTLPNYRKAFFNSLSTQLAESGIEMVVYHGSTKKRDIKRIEGQQFNTVAFETSERSLKGFVLTTLKGLKREVVKNNSDALVLLFNPSVISQVSVLLYCLRKKIPYALWSCGWIRPNINGMLSRVRERLLDYFEQRASVHIAYHTTRKRYLESKNIASDKIFIAQNTIDTEAIMSSYNIEEVNKHRFKDKIKVVFVGGLIRDKHLEEAMSAVDKLIFEGHQMTFTIVGGGSIIDELISYRDSLKNGNEINIVGPKFGDELRPYFLESDVFLLAGSGGLAINEAMAYGLPVISTDGDGTGFDLIEGNGYLLQNIGDKDEIKSALSQFAGLSREQKLEMSEKSLSIVKNKATNALMVQHFVEAINSMLNKQ